MPLHAELPPDDTALDQILPSASTTTRTGGASGSDATEVSIPKWPEDFCGPDRAKVPRLDVPISEPPSKLRAWYMILRPH